MGRYDGRRRPETQPLHPGCRPGGPPDRPVRGPGDHALSARAERLPAHRPRQVHLPQLRPRRRSTAASATCASTTPTPPRKSRSTSSRSCDDVRWLGFDWDERLFYASDYFEQLYEWAVAAHQGGQGVRLRPDGRRGPRVSRHPDRARQGEPVPRPLASRRTSTCSRRMRAGEFPDGARTLRAKIDMASPNMNLRDPVHVPHPAAPRTTAPATAGASTRCTTGPTASRDAIEGITHSHLHAGVRGPSAALRLVPRRSSASTRPQQIEFARLEPDLHRDEQAQAAAAGEGRRT